MPKDADILPKKLQKALFVVLLSLCAGLGAAQGACAQADIKTTPGATAVHSSQTPSDAREAVAAMWDFSDPAASEVKFQAAFAAADPNSAWGLILRTQIARTLGLRKRFDEALAVLDTQEAAAASHPMRLVRMFQTIERGRTLNSWKRAAEALPLFQRVFDWGREPHAASEPGVEALAVDAIHMVAIAQGGEAAIATNRQGLLLARASSDAGARRWEGPFLNNIGYELKALKRYDEALAVFHEAIAPYERRGVAWQTRIVHWHIAHIHRLQGKPDLALAIQERLEREADAEGKPDAYIYEELMLAHAGKQQAVSAQSYARKAQGLLKTDAWFHENEAARWAEIQRLAR